MFIALYEFRIKDGFAENFKESWATLTEGIYRCKGSLGSRLHSTDHPNAFVAYAQWPTKEAYESEALIEPYTKEEVQARSKMRECCEEIKTLHLMDVIDDKLKELP